MREYVRKNKRENNREERQRSRVGKGKFICIYFCIELLWSFCDLMHDKNKVKMRAEILKKWKIKEMIFTVACYECLVGIKSILCGTIGN